MIYLKYARLNILLICLTAFACTTTLPESENSVQFNIDLSTYERKTDIKQVFNSAENLIELKVEEPISIISKLSIIDENLLILDRDTKNNNLYIFSNKGKLLLKFKSLLSELDNSYISDFSVDTEDKNLLYILDESRNLIYRFNLEKLAIIDFIEYPMNLTRLEKTKNGYVFLKVILQMI